MVNNQEPLLASGGKARHVSVDAVVHEGLGHGYEFFEIVSRVGHGPTLDIDAED